MAAQLEVRAEQLGAEMERSGQVLTAMSEGVLLMDADGRPLLRGNPAAGMILGADLQGMEGTAARGGGSLVPRAGSGAEGAGERRGHHRGARTCPSAGRCR